MLDGFRHKGLRRKMIDYLKSKKGIINQNVLDAMISVPRHLFLDSSFLEFAYEDKAFPIGNDQTISSLYTVAFQTDLLDVNKGEKILEIGTGSGYQTSILSFLGSKVYSVERHRDLYRKAKLLLSKLNYHANLYYADGYLGISEEAPFDKILLTCGATEVPEVLLSQLKEGGLMVIPIGLKEQIMTVIIKLSNGKVRKIEYENFKFVPFLRDRS